MKQPVGLTQTQYELFHAIRAGGKTLIKHVVGGGRIYFHKLDGKLLSSASEKALDELIVMGAIVLDDNHDETGRYSFTKAMTELIENNHITDEQLKKLWSKLGDIPTDENDEIEEEFLDFEIGTHREDIWHWFDRKHSKGVAEGLMYPNTSST